MQNIPLCSLLPLIIKHMRAKPRHCNKIYTACSMACMIVKVEKYNNTHVYIGHVKHNVLYIAKASICDDSCMQLILIHFCYPRLCSKVPLDALCSMVLSTSMHMQRQPIGSP